MNWRLIKICAIVVTVSFWVVLIGFEPWVHPRFAKPIPTSERVSALVAVTVSNGVSSRTPGPLAVCTSNPRYFCDPAGNVVFLSGGSTWADSQNLGNNRAPNTGSFDFKGFVSFNENHGYTWVRLWASTVYSHDFCCTSYNPYVGSVWPWKRVGPGNDDSGQLKTDLKEFDPNYFSRVRNQIIQLGQAGIYVSVEVFNDLSELPDVTGNGDPFVSTNNINGISGGQAAVISNTVTGTVWSIEQAYIHLLIDTLHGLPNVMWDVAVEPPVANAGWVTKVLNEINTYEQATYGTHHPIGMNYGNFVADSNVYNTNADFVSPSTKVPPPATGQCPVVTGNGGAVNTTSGRCKVVINDSDHSYYYTHMLSDGPTGQITWAWENFTLGNGVAFMDPYTFPWSGRNACTGTPTDGDSGLCATNGLDSQWNPIRQAIGDVVAYAKKIDLKHMTPQGSLSTSGYVLADHGSQYLVFGNSNMFTVATEPGIYTFEWFNPSKHTIVETGSLKAVNSQTFTAPFSGAAVLWLHK